MLAHLKRISPQLSLRDRSDSQSQSEGDSTAYGLLSISQQYWRSLEVYHYTCLLVSCKDLYFFFKLQRTLECVAISVMGPKCWYLSMICKTRLRFCDSRTSSGHRIQPERFCNKCRNVFLLKNNLLKSTCYHRQSRKAWPGSLWQTSPLLSIGLCSCNLRVAWTFNIFFVITQSHYDIQCTSKLPEHLMLFLPVLHRDKQSDI